MPINGVPPRDSKTEFKRKRRLTNEPKLEKDSMNTRSFDRLAKNSMRNSSNIEDDISPTIFNINKTLD